MEPSIALINHIGDYRLQDYVDPNDIIAKRFEIERKQILHGDNLVFNININHDVNDYSVFWYKKLTYDLFLDVCLETLNDIHKNVSNFVKEKHIGHSFMPDTFYTCHMSFQQDTKYSEMMLPFDKNYFFAMSKRNLSFIRLEMPYFHVWTYLSETISSESIDEIGWTSDLYIPNYILDFYYSSYNMSKYDNPEESSALESLLSDALHEFNRS